MTKWTMEMFVNDIQVTEATNDSETEEVERLVMKAPEKKPPREDRRRRRMQVKDPDLAKSKDKDLSLNYKDIGGSLKGKLGPTLVSLDKLGDLLSEKGEKAAQEASEVKCQPLPPGWDPEIVFQDAQISLPYRRRYRRHIQDWDSNTFLLNQVWLRERLLESELASGRDDTQDYWRSLIKIVEDTFTDIYGTPGPDYSLDMKSIVESLPKGTVKENPTALAEIITLTRTWVKGLQTTKVDLKALYKEAEEALKSLDKKSAAYFGVKKFMELLRGVSVMSKVKLSSLHMGARFAQYRGVYERGGAAPRDTERFALLSDSPSGYTDVDYQAILKDALWWLAGSSMRTTLATTNLEFSCRIALDYAIWDFQEGMYQSRITPSIYNTLLGVMVEALTSGQV